MCTKFHDPNLFLSRVIEGGHNVPPLGDNSTKKRPGLVGLRYLHRLLASYLRKVAIYLVMVNCKENMSHVIGVIKY
jgi:hypothetical protein